jgi:putative endonuclease|tara:strand:+ start:656 stop:880 length:225 start_codon:yes stop_codon:yes gene_type:complete
MGGVGYVYIMASMTRGTLYVGVTSDLAKRAWQHRTGALRGFSKKHGTKRLVCFEVRDEVAAAIAREKEIKKWRR